MLDGTGYRELLLLTPRLPSVEGWGLLPRTADTMRELGVTLIADPQAGALSIDGELPEWAVICLEVHHRWLVTWWRSSPSAILACDTCGEPKIVGKRPSTKKRCFMGGKHTWQPQNKAFKSQTVTWGCQGRFEVVDLPWSAKRPRRKRAKVES